MGRFALSVRADHDQRRANVRCGSRDYSDVPCPQELWAPHSISTRVRIAGSSHHLHRPLRPGGNRRMVDAADHQQAVEQSPFRKHVQDVQLALGLLREEVTRTTARRAAIERSVEAVFFATWEMSRIPTCSLSLRAMGSLVHTRCQCLVTLISIASRSR